MADYFDMEKCMQSLRLKRSIFNSEADFQFALAWEIQLHYPTAKIRLELKPEDGKRERVDIMIYFDSVAIPIELKYKTAVLKVDLNDEKYSLSAGAQDIDRYDCLKDIQRIEEWTEKIPNFFEGYAIWLINDASYWNAPSGRKTTFESFDICDGIEKNGEMKWAEHASTGSMQGREKPINLNGFYKIKWIKFSEIATKNGTFKYCINRITRDSITNDNTM